MSISGLHEVSSIEYLALKIVGQTNGDLNLSTSKIRYLRPDVLKNKLVISNKIRQNEVRLEFISGLFPEKFTVAGKRPRTPIGPSRLDNR